MNEEPTMQDRLSRLRHFDPPAPATEAAQAVEQAILEVATSDVDERRANAVNSVLHAKGVLATVTPDEAASIWLIANTLDSVSG